jgi:predicted XRE-type DNA-binding protein
MSKTRNNGRRGIDHEEGSSDVFADLGLRDGDKRLARSNLGFHVYDLLCDRQLTPREIAALLGIKQPEVSHLMNGHFNRFTTDKLLSFLSLVISSGSHKRCLARWPYSLYGRD